MTPSDLEHFEQRLLKERGRVVRALQRHDDTAHGDRDGDLTSYPFHLADEGTDTDEEEKGFLLRTKEGRLLAEIDDALRRLYKQPGRFGTCEVCGREIATERLELLPWTRLCLACQQDAESRPE